MCEHCDRREKADARMAFLEGLLREPVQQMRFGYEHGSAAARVFNEVMAELRRLAGLVEKKQATPTAMPIWQCDTCESIEADGPGAATGICLCGGRLVPGQFVPNAAD